MSADPQAGPAWRDMPARNQALACALRCSGLGEAPAALRALAVPGARAAARIEGRKASALILAYARRRLLLAPFRSAHAARLRRAIAELIANLRPIGRLPVDILDIRCRRRRRFLVFRIGGGAVLGCLPYAAPE